MSQELVQKISINADLQVAGIKKGISEIESAFAGMKMDKGLESSLRKLKEDLAAFAEVAKKEIGNMSDAKNFEKTWSAVGRSLESVQKKLEGIKVDPKKMVGSDTINKLNEVKSKLVELYNVRKQKQDFALISEQNFKEADNAVKELGKNLEGLKEKRTNLDTQFEAAQKNVNETVAEVNRLDAELKEAKKNGDLGDLPGQLEAARIKANDAKNELRQTGAEIKKVDQAIAQAELDLPKAKEGVERLKEIAKEAKEASQYSRDLREFRAEVEKISGKKLPLSNLEQLIKIVETLEVEEQAKLAPAMEKVAKAAREQSEAVGGSKKSFQDFGKAILETINNSADFTKQVQALTNQVTQFFSLTNGWNLLKRAIESAVEVVKELDEAMTGMAVVSEYTLADIWGKRGDFSANASALGVSTLDLVNATTLYVQQGLDLNEAMGVAIETMKMGRIANLEGEEATNLMTAALRGYNMEMTQAAHVNDVYSNLAAKTASDTEELATAMSKTASIAYNSGASFENMSAFLAQIIETTREAPETAGTAMKTIIARFQELKKPLEEIGEVEGEAVDANKIETALRSAGVALRDAKGEFRDFDDVILELSGKWSGLDKMTQRYIATMAAGSRQQSRFIALLDNNERLLELTGYAANSAGKSQDQFNKTLDSLQSKLARMQNELDQFFTNLANNKVVKQLADTFTEFLHIINSIIAPLSNSESAILNWAGALIELVGIVGAFMGSLKLISLVVTKVTGGMAKMAAVTITETGATVANIKTKKGLSKVLTQLIAKIFGVSEAEAALLVAENADTVATVANEKVKNKLALANIKATIAEKGLKTAFVETLAAAAPVLSVVLTIAAAIAALVVIAKVLDDSIFSIKEQTLSYQKTVDETTDSINKLQEQEEKVASSLKTLEEEKTVLKTLTQGTNEWYEELRKVNGIILSLSNDIPDMAQYLQIDANGMLGYSEEGYNYLKEYQEKLKNQEIAASKALLRAERDKRELEIQKSNDELKKDYAKRINDIFYKSTHYTIQNPKGILEKGKVNTEYGLGQYLTEEDVNNINSLIADYNLQLKIGKKEIEGYNKQLGQLYGEDRYDQIVGAIIESNTSEMSKAMSRLASEGVAEIPGMINYLNISEAHNTAIPTEGSKLITKKEFLTYYASQLGDDLKNINVDTLDGIKEIYHAATGLYADSEATYDEIFRMLTNNYVEYTKQSKEAFDGLTDKQKNAVVAYYDLLEGRVDNFTKEELKALMSISDGTQKALGFERDDLIEGQVEAARESYRAIKKEQKKQLERNVATLLGVAAPKEAHMAANIGLGQNGLYNTRYEPYLEDINNILENPNFSKEVRRKFVLDVLPQIKDEDLQSVINQVQSIDFSSPINAYQQIQALAKTDNAELEDMCNTMLKQQSLSFSEQIKELETLGDDSNNLNNELDKLIESNGKITANDVKNLSKSYNQLNGFMKNANINASTLAKTLTGVYKGKFSIDSITEAVIKAISKFNEADELIEQVHNDLSQFDPGYDTAETEDFFVGAYDNIKKHLDNYDWGNPQIDAYINKIWGPDLLGAAESAEERLDIIYEKMELLGKIKETNSLTPWFEELAAAADEAGESWEYTWKIIDNGDTIDLNTDNFKGTLEDLEKEFAEAFQLPPETAKMFLAGWGNESPGFLFNLRRNGYESGLQTFVDEATVKNSKDLIVSLEEIEALAEASSYSTDKVKKDLEEAAKARGGRFIIHVDYSELESAEEIYNNLFGTNGPEETPILDISNYFSNGNLDIDSALSDLMSRGNLDQGTAEAVVAHMMSQLGESFKTATYEGNIDIPADKFKVGEGQFSLGQDIKEKIEEDIKSDEFGAMITESIVAALDQAGEFDINFSGEEALAIIEGQINDVADQNYSLDNLSINSSVLNSAVDTALNQGYHSVKLHAIWSNGSKTLTITASGGFDPGKGGKFSLSIPEYAEGTPHASVKHMALLGEGAGPELVQTKKGGAYIAGINGPEIGMIYPGDIVYSNEDTKKIFARGGLKIPRYENGYNIPRYEIPSSSVTKPGTGTDDSTVSDNTKAIQDNTDATEENTEKWKTSIDFLLRQTSRLEAYAQREELLSKERENLTKQYNNDLESLVTYHKALIQVYDQTESMNREILSRSRGELARLRSEYSNITKEGKSILDYFDVDEKNGLLPNYDLISQVTDETWGKQIEEAQSKFEDLLKKIWDAEKQIRDTQAKRIEELQLYEDITREIEDKLIQAIVAEREAEIDKQESIYNAITEGNRQMLDALQQGISDARAQRDMDKQNQEIGESERRLALMSMDTSGANRLDILKEQQSLDDKRQSYTDSLIDKSIEQMEKDAEKAAAQRDFQIELMRQQLEVAKKNEIPAEADKLIQNIGKDATRKEILEKLKVLDNYEEMGFFNRQNYNAEMTQNLNEVRTNLGTQSRGGAGMISGLSDFANSKGKTDNSATAKTAAQTQALTLQYANDNAKRNAVIQKFMKASNINTVDEAVARGIAWAMEIGGSGWSKDRITNAFGSAMFERVEQIRKSIIAGTTDLKGLNLSNKEVADAFKFKQFAIGGIVNFTGPAWLDGTKSNPEYVLNADDTKRFFDLVDFTKDIGNDNNSTLIGDTYYNISMSNEIASDYDVDSMWDEMQRKIYENAAYRNVQSLNFGRR